MFWRRRSANNVDAEAPAPVKEVDTDADGTEPLQRPVSPEQISHQEQAGHSEQASQPDDAPQPEPLGQPEPEPQPQPVQEAADYPMDEAKLPVQGEAAPADGPDAQAPEDEQEQPVPSDQTRGATMDGAQTTAGTGQDPASAAVAQRERAQLQMPAQGEKPGPADTQSQAFPGPLVLGSRPPSFPSALGPLPGLPVRLSTPAVPDTVLDGADLPGLTIRGASLRGDEHRYAAKVRQDSMGMWPVADQDLAAVLVCAADGVGSEALSHLGAADACRLVRDMAEPNVSRLFRAARQGSLQDFWQYMAENVAEHLIKRAERLRVDPKTLSTTLAAALVEMNPAHPAERRYVILNVGDAAAYVLRDGKFERCLDDPHAGTIADTATSALPTSIGQAGAATGTIGTGDMLMVCTDGMSNPMSNREVLEQLAAWWGDDPIPSLPEFGWQVSYRVRSFGDDRTAVCVWGR